MTLLRALPWWGWTLIGVLVGAALLYAVLRWIVKAEYTH